MSAEKPMSTVRSKVEWKKRYEPDDEGLRFIDLTYTWNYPDLPPVTDGILPHLRKSGAYDYACQELNL
jgi:hypothetical protein